MERTVQSVRPRPGADVQVRRPLNLREEVGLTFDDVLLVPRYSEIRSRQDTRTDTMFSRRIKLHTPIVSSNMDTVTEAGMAIVMARLGGIGVIHRFMAPERQADEVRRVKRAEALVVENPLVLPPDANVGQARAEMQRHGVGGVIITDEERHVEGIITRRDVMFVEDDDTPITSVMTPRSRLYTAPEGSTLEEARDILIEARVEKLPLIDREGRLTGLITVKDIEQMMHYPHATKDGKGHLRVAAAVGVRPGFAERAGLLLEAGADALVVDIAHGDSANAIEATKELRSRFGDSWDLVVGNVATAEATERLVDSGADAVKVGVGPGSICITRLVTGFGVPQLSAIAECAGAARGYEVPVIADGGIRNSGDLVKALAAGAMTAMIGSLLAGTKESPGIVVVRNGTRYKLTRGMAGLGATMDRDLLENPTSQLLQYEKVVPEGVEATVTYRGPVEGILTQLVGGLRSGMSYAGAQTVVELQRNAEFIRITPAGLRESGPHDVGHL